LPGFWPWLPSGVAGVSPDISGMEDVGVVSGMADGVSPGLTMAAPVSGAVVPVDSGVIDGMSVSSLAATVLFTGGSATGTVVVGFVGTAGADKSGVPGWADIFEGELGAAGEGPAGVMTPVGGGVSAGCLLPPIIIRNASNSPTVSSWLHYMFMYFHHTLYALFVHPSKFRENARQMVD